MTDYEWLTTMNLCHKCRKEKPAPERKYCFECLEKIREEDAKRYDPEKAKKYQARRRELYREKKSKGICVRCSRPATHGMHCYECHINQKRRSIINAQRRKNYRRDRRLIPEQRKKEGKCLWCGEDAINGLQCCEKHRKIFSEAGKKGYQQNLINKNNLWINEVEAWKKKNNWKPSGSI